jgi:hypothetical protein
LGVSQPKKGRERIGVSLLTSTEDLSHYGCDGVVIGLLTSENLPDKGGDCHFLHRGKRTAVADFLEAVNVILLDGGGVDLIGDEAEKKGL